MIDIGIREDRLDEHRKIIWCFVASENVYGEHTLMTTAAWELLGEYDRLVAEIAAKQRGYDDLHRSLDMAHIPSGDVWSRVEFLVAGLKNPTKEYFELEVQNEDGSWRVWRQNLTEKGALSFRREWQEDTTQPVRIAKYLLVRSEYP